jgi:PmbA protein
VGLIDNIIKTGKGWNVEVELSKTKETGILFEIDGLKKNSVGDITNLYICVNKNKKIGFSSTTDVDKWEECLNNAIKIAKVAEPLKHFFGIPPKQTYSKLPYSKDVENLSEEKLIKNIRISINDSKSYDKRIEINEAGITRMITDSIFKNSNGIENRERIAYLGAGLNTKAKERSYYDYFASRKNDIDYSLLGKNCAKESINSMTPRKIETGKYDVVFGYNSLRAVLSPIIASLCADRAQKQRSMYSKKIGHEIVDKSLTIIDDRTLKGGLMSGERDEEGVSGKRTVLIENGVLKGFMYDFLTANKENRESTGNCNAFSIKPSIGPSNFIIKPGSFSDKELLTQKCILVKSVLGEHTVNPDSGSFSLTVRNGYIFDKGKLNSVKRCMISGNIFELINNVDVGKRSRQDNFLSVPWIKIKNVQIIS